MRETGLKRAAASLALLIPIAGCSTINPAADPGGGSFGDLFSRSSTPAAQTAAAAPQAREIKVDCPIVQVSDDQAAYRAWAGADRSSAGVKYQYSFADMSRECVATPDRKIEIRVGVAGYVLAGPAGGSGNFNVPVKVTIRRESDQTIAVSKVYRIATSIPAGETQSTFSTVTEPLVVPFLSESADDDYSIYVGFDGGSASETPKKRVPRRRRG